MSAGVVVGYDGSDCAKAALGVALEVGRAYGELVTIALGYELSPVGGEVRDYREALRELATGACARPGHWSATTPGRSRR